MRRNARLLRWLAGSLGIGLLALAAAACSPQAAVDRDRTSSRAARVHRDAFVFDGHCDTALDMLREEIDLGRRRDDGHIDIPRMRAGGLDAQVFALWPEPDHWPDHAARRTLQLADAVLRAIERHPDELALARSAADARRIQRSGRIAVFLGIEGGHAIEDELALLRMFHRLGVRLMTLTWMRNTHWADASGDEAEHGGLTPFGERVVREMNRLGMVIDVSHVADSTFYHVLRISRRPVVASHSGARAVCPHHRNLDDAMLRALAENGGVVGINYFTGFLDPRAAPVFEAMWDELEPLWQAHRDQPERYRELRKPIVARYEARLPRVTIARLLDHIDHVVQVAGIDHVALGSDFDGISYTPAGLDDVSDLPHVTAGLLERGYSADEVRRILGGNLMRVFAAAIGR